MDRLFAYFMVFLLLLKTGCSPLAGDLSCTEDDVLVVECSSNEGTGTQKSTCIEGQWKLSDCIVSTKQEPKIPDTEPPAGDGPGTEPPVGDDPGTEPPAGEEPRDSGDCENVLGLSCEEFEEAYIKASNTNDLDHFGYAVDIYEDTMVVGAPGEDSSSRPESNSVAGAGAVYVFSRTGDRWGQEAYLKASNTDEKDFFGASVAIYGQTIVVGVPREDSLATGIDGNPSDNSGEDIGAVYIFGQEDGQWEQQAYLKASDTGDFDFFGFSVAIHRDTVVVGALGQNGPSVDNSPQFLLGSAYVFVRENNLWRQQAQLQASSLRSLDYFGSSVDIHEDTIVVGAMGDNAVSNGDIQLDTGAAYVFVRNGEEWTEQAALTAPNPAPDDVFGSAVAIDDNIIVVGAPEEEISFSIDNQRGTSMVRSSSTGDGSVYVFVRSNNQWRQQAHIKASNVDGLDHFGSSVAIDGEYLTVGAYQEDSKAIGINGDEDDNSSSSSGAVYLFSWNGSIWAQKAYIKSSNTGAGDAFGQSVALDGDRLVIGAPEEDSDATGINNDQDNDLAPDSGGAYLRNLRRRRLP